MEALVINMITFDIISDHEIYKLYFNTPISS